MDDTLPRIELVIYGYLRDYEKHIKLSNIFPDQLKNVIIMLYPRNRFKFIGQFEKNEAKIQDEGTKLVKIGSEYWRTCQIGDFFDINDKLIHKITLKAYNNDETIIGFNNIGFLTKGFTKFAMRSWNPGNNGLTYLSSNGYFVTSKCFDKEMSESKILRKNIK